MNDIFFSSTDRTNRTGQIRTHMYFTWDPTLIKLKALLLLKYISEDYTIEFLMNGFLQIFIRIVHEFCTTVET